MSKLIGNNLQAEGIQSINGIPVNDLGGGGDGGNYIQAGSNANTQADVDLYTRYADTAGNNPVDGQGGSPTITWTRNTTDPLVDPADFLFGKDAVNRQGQGVSIPFIIDNRHLATVLQISGDAVLGSGIYTNRLFNAIATYSVTSNVATVTFSNTFTTGTKVTVVFETGGATALSSEFTLTGATSTTFTFALTTANTTGNCKVSYVGDLRASIIEDPSGTPVVNEPDGTDIQLAVIGNNVKFIANFQTSKTIKNYRLCIHSSGSTTNAFSVSFSNIKVWEQEKNYGAIVTDWQSYTPVLTNLGTGATSNLYWRRNGQNLEIKGRITTGSGVPGSVGGFSTPNGVTFDSNICATRQAVGLMIRASGSINQVNILALAPESIFYFSGGDGSAINTGLVPQNTSAILDSSTIHSVNLTVPIQGWGSNMALSSDAGSGRPVVGAYYGHTGVALTANVTTIKINTVIKDSHNAYNPVTGVVTIPEAGDYVFMMNEIPIVSGDIAMQPYVKNQAYNGVFVGILNPTTPNGFSITIPDLKAGQTVDFRSPGNVTTVTRAVSFSFYKINSGSQILARDESVFASYYSGANQTSLTTQINFGIKLYDSHDAVTTGAGWRFTAPVRGRYLLTGSIYADATYRIELFKNGSKIIHALILLGSSGYSSFSKVVTLLSGEFIDLRSATSVTIVGGNINSSNVSQIEITLQK